ncbi:MAG TPA: GNAT family N-acetyltransferase [Candidatus Competibacteraceae bacterium]|nr:GNAT family N-acetyltransferase [Candidatus Competibacteraceae bacterium]HSA48391.1 GNAT family N-acetyltransferase [Candidatus Competibacteraceae bacterium]
MNLVPAQTVGDVETARALFREYQRFLGVDLDFQGFEEELATLPGRYAPPRGRLLLARDGAHAAGCVALRPLEEEGVCEMKRLFVRPAYRGQGLGYRLAMQIVNEATALGYAIMRLDTLDTLDSAMRMYAAMGFQRRTPYYANPLPGVVYWERVLLSHQQPCGPGAP